MKQLKKKLEKAEKFDQKYVDGLVLDMERLKTENAKLHESIRRQSKSWLESSGRESSSSRSSPTVEGLDMSIDSGYVRQCEKIERQNEKLRDEVSTANEFLKNQAAELERLSKENDAIKRDLQRVTVDKQKADEIYIKQQGELQNTLKHNEDLEVEVEELNRIKGEIEELNQVQAEELSKFSQNDDKLKREIDWLKKSQKDMDDVRKTLQKELERSKLNIDELSKELDEKTDFIKAQVKETDKLKLKIIRLEKELSENRENPSRAENEKLMDEYLRIQEELASAKQTNVKLSSDVSDLRKKWVVKEEEYEARVLSHVNENAKLHDRVKILEKQAAPQPEIVKKSVSSIQHGRLLDDSSKLREMELKCSDLQAEVRSLTAECRKVGEQRANEEKENAEKITRLREENSRLHTQVSELLCIFNSTSSFYFDVLMYFENS